MRNITAFSISLAIITGSFVLVASFPRHLKNDPKEFSLADFHEEEVRYRSAIIKEATSILDEYVIPIIEEIKEEEEGETKKELEKIYSNLELIPNKLKQLESVQPIEQNNSQIKEVLGLIPSNDWAEEYEVEDIILLREQINKLTIKWFPDTEKIKLGRNLYKQLCMTCHGMNGNAIPVSPEPTFDDLKIYPRDFTGKTHSDDSVVFKFISTDKNVAPALEKDLYDTIKNGLPGTPMPGFAYLDDNQIYSLIEYIKSFGFIDWKYKHTNKPEIVVPEVPDNLTSLKRVEQGRKIYKQLCITCHGDIEKGENPPEAKALEWTDPYGNEIEIFPRNFAKEPLRKGNPAELFKTIRLGIAGTSMPKNTLSDNETWNIISYILYLRESASQQTKGEK